MTTHLLVSVGNVKERVARTYGMAGGEFAKYWHCFEVKLDRRGRPLRKGVERTVCNARRTQESRGSEGLHGKTDLYIDKVFWMRHGRQRVGQRYLIVIGPVSPRGRVLWPFQWTPLTFYLLSMNIRRAELLARPTQKQP